MDWIDERLQISPIFRAFVDRKLPGNIGWAHTLGSATILFLIVQIATGIVLTLSYVPSPSAAYESVLYIDQTPFGALVRGSTTGRRASSSSWSWSTPCGSSSGRRTGIRAS